MDVHLTIIDDEDGQTAMAFSSQASSHGFAADYARNRSDERKNRQAPDDFGQLDDGAIIGAFFEDHHDVQAWFHTCEVLP